jgi:uncharacterized protein (TIGR02246 family)
MKFDATLQRFLEELVDAWNRRNAASFGRLFAEDADYVTGSGVRLSGRGQIQDLVYARSATPAAPGQVSVATESVKMLGSDAAVILCAWHMGPGDAQTTCEPVVRAGVMTIVAQRTGGTWQIIALHNTDSPQ